jgi:DNA-binding transcriptional MerR regulator
MCAWGLARSDCTEVGELARRVGVAPETLRAWERRYGVLHPARTPGGYRVYGSDDELRARRMRELIESGWAAGEAAHAITTTREPHVSRPAGGAVEELLAALLGFDSAAGHAAFDRVLAARSMDAALRDAVLPALHEMGERWARGEVSLAQEHFATELITGRLRALGREWDKGLGPRAVLACPALAQLGGRVMIGVGGAGATPALATAASALHLRGDPVSAAASLTDAAAASARSR